MNWNPPRWVPLKIFFQSFFWKEQLLFSFLCIVKQKKKISECSKKFWNFSIFKNFRITPKFFFALQYIKNWTKVVPWNFFLFLKKKLLVWKKLLKRFCWWDPQWRISIHRDFDSLDGLLSPCGSHWLR